MYSYPLSRGPLRLILSALTILCVALPAIAADEPIVQPARKIAVFGSSVAHGSCDHENRGGYCGRLGELLRPRGWEVVNVSRGGDNTITIAPRLEAELLPRHAGYVIIGLSLSNEGIAKEETREYRDRIFEQWRSGVIELTRRCRAAGMSVVVGNCYARDSFVDNPELYAYTRRMNIEISRMDVPSINFLGAIDNGAGGWVKDFQMNAGHPNGSGHQEMFLAIVPSLFEAMEAGKPLPAKAKGDRYACQPGGESSLAPLSFKPADTIHSYAVSFWVRLHSDGVIAAITAGKTDLKSREFTEKDKPYTVRTIESLPDSLDIELSCRDNKIVYNGFQANRIESPATGNTDWHHIVLSHGCARGVTQLFVDGAQVGEVNERLIPKEFVLAGNTSPATAAKADYREWAIYRSSLNLEQVRFLYEGGLFQSSMEVYAPLADPSFETGTCVENRAQSMSQVLVTRDGLVTDSANGLLKP